MHFTVKDLLRMIEQLNIPMDAEVWLEYPAAYGVIPSHPDNPTFEHTQPNIEQGGPFEQSDWIIASTMGWSAAENKLRLFHHY